jgi:hypothetical protein
MIWNGYPRFIFWYFPERSNRELVQTLLIISDLRLTLIANLGKEIDFCSLNYEYY